MMDYLQIFPETLEALDELDDAQLGRMIRAMTVYATTGQEPDFEKGTGERMLWKSMKQRIDAAIRKSGINAANRKRTKSNEKNEEQRNETNRNPETESEPETEAEPDPEGDKHTPEDSRQVPRGRAREGWFDPNEPDAPCDAAWQSERGRLAVAQRILDWFMTVHMTPTGMIPQRDEEGPMGDRMLDLTAGAMASGVPPREIVHSTEKQTGAAGYEEAVARLIARNVGTDGLAGYSPGWAARLRNEHMDAMKALAKGGGRGGGLGALPPERGRFVCR